MAQKKNEYKSPKKQSFLVHSNDFILDQNLSAIHNFQRNFEPKSRYQQQQGKNDNHLQTEVTRSRLPMLNLNKVKQSLVHAHEIQKDNKFLEEQEIFLKRRGLRGHTQHIDVYLNQKQRKLLTHSASSSMDTFSNQFLGISKYWTPMNDTLINKKISSFSRSKIIPDGHKVNGSKHAAVTEIVKTNIAAPGSKVIFLTTTIMPINNELITLFQVLKDDEF